MEEQRADHGATGSREWPRMPGTRFDTAMKKIFKGNPLRKLDRTKWWKKNIEPTPQIRSQEVLEQLDKILPRLSSCFDRCEWDEGMGQDDAPPTARKTRQQHADSSTTADGSKPKRAPRANAKYFVRNPITGAVEDLGYGDTEFRRRVCELATTHLRPLYVEDESQAPLDADLEEFRCNPAREQAVLDKSVERREAARTEVMGDHSRELLSLCASAEAKLYVIEQSAKDDARGILDGTDVAALKSVLRNCRRWLLNVGEGKVFALLGSQGQGKSTILASLLLLYLDLSVYRTDPFPHDIVLLLPVLQHMRKHVQGCQDRNLVELLEDKSILRIAMPLNYGAAVAMEECTHTRAAFCNFGVDGELFDLRTFVPGSACKGSPSTSVAIAYTYGEYMLVMVELRSVEEVQAAVAPLLQHQKEVYKKDVELYEGNTATVKDEWSKWNEREERQNWAVGDGSYDEKATHEFEKLLQIYREVCGERLPWYEDGREGFSEEPTILPELQALLEHHRFIAFTGPTGPSHIKPAATKQHGGSASSGAGQEEAQQDKAGDDDVAAQQILQPEQVELFLNDVTSRLQDLAHLHGGTAMQRLQTCLPPKLNDISWRKLAHVMVMPVVVHLPVSLFAGGQRAEDVPGFNGNDKAHDSVRADALANRINTAVVIAENSVAEESCRATLDVLIEKLYARNLLSEAMIRPQQQQLVVSEVGAGVAAAAETVVDAHGQEPPPAMAIGGFTAGTVKHTVALMHLADGHKSVYRRAEDLQNRFDSAGTDATSNIKANKKVWRERVNAFTKRMSYATHGRRTIAERQQGMQLPCIVDPHMDVFCPLLDMSLSLNEQLCRKLDKLANNKKSSLPSVEDLFKHMNHQFILQHLVAANKEGLLQQISSIKEVLDEQTEIRGLSELLQTYREMDSPAAMRRTAVRKKVNMVDDTQVKMVDDTQVNMVDDIQVNMVDDTQVNMVDYTQQVNMVDDTQINKIDKALLPTKAEVIRRFDCLLKMLEQVAETARTRFDVTVKKVLAAPESDGSQQHLCCDTVVEKWVAMASNLSNVPTNLEGLRITFLQPENLGKHVQFNLYTLAESLCAPLKEIFIQINTDIGKCMAEFLLPIKGPGKEPGLGAVISAGAILYFQECMEMQPQDSMKMNSLIGDTYEARTARQLSCALQARLRVLDQLDKGLAEILEMRMRDMLEVLVEGTNTAQHVAGLGNKRPRSDEPTLLQLLKSGMAQLLKGVASDLATCADDLPSSCMRTIKTMLLPWKEINRWRKPEDLDDTIDSKSRGQMKGIFLQLVRELDTKRRGATKRMDALKSEWIKQLNSIKTSLVTIQKKVEKLPNGGFEHVITSKRPPIRVVKQGLPFTYEDIAKLDAMKLPPLKAAQELKKLTSIRKDSSQRVVKKWDLKTSKMAHFNYGALTDALEAHGLQRVGVARNGDRLLSALLVGMTGDMKTPGPAELIRELRVRGTQAALKLAHSEKDFHDAMEQYLNVDQPGRWDAPSDWSHAMQQPGAGADYFLLQGIVQAQGFRLLVWLTPPDTLASPDMTVETPMAARTRSKQAARTTTKGQQVQADAAPGGSSSSAVVSAEAALAGQHEASGSQAKVQLPAGKLIVLLLEPFNVDASKHLPIYGLALVQPGKMQIHSEAVVKLPDDTDGAGADHGDGDCGGNSDGGGTDGTGGSESGGDCAHEEGGPDEDDTGMQFELEGTGSEDVEDAPSAQQPQELQEPIPEEQYVKSQSQQEPQQLPPGPSRLPQQEQPARMVSRSMVAQERLHVLLDISILRNSKGSKSLKEFVQLLERSTCPLRVYATRTLLDYVILHGSRQPDQLLRDDQKNAQTLYPLLASQGRFFGGDFDKQPSVIEKCIHEAIKLKATTDKAIVNEAIDEEDVELHRTLIYAKYLFEEKVAHDGRLLLLYWSRCNDLFDTLEQGMEPKHGRWIRMSTVAAVIGAGGDVAKWFGSRTNSTPGEKWTFGPHFYWIKQLV